MHIFRQWSVRIEKYDWSVTGSYFTYESGIMWSDSIGQLEVHKNFILRTCLIKVLQGKGGGGGGERTAFPSKIHSLQSQPL